MKEYDHKKIESKWQKKWEENRTYEVKEEVGKKKFYGLIEFPYPSGAGLHVGHIRSNTAMDIITRKKRMEGFNVLYPIGWDAFGLPTENYAIKTGIQPEKVTKTNTDVFRKQLKKGGFGFAWSREINTTDPKYYKWTQWIFLQMYKKGLAYKDKTLINWCPSCKIGLANEEVINGLCDRCGSEVTKKEKEQWMLAITKYADRLDRDLDKVNYLEKIKVQQRNWIGKSEGAEIKFKVIATNFSSSLNFVEVFTTRADTIFGATYIVLAPEHKLIEELKSNITNWKEVESYIMKVKKKTDIERTSPNKNKTGVELKGIKVINPANGKEIPVWVADYVLASYGTGAVMAVPAHDERDFEFAKKYNLPITEVISGGKILEKAFTSNGTLINSGKFNGMFSEKARKEITKFIKGKIVTRYKLRDWVFSRQRYWGEPIPIINCSKCGYVPVPEKELPVVLPKVKSYKPTDNGESPLASISKWVNTKCPVCGSRAKRETDTMPNWAGSSWYFLRYTDPKNDKNFAGQKALNYWMRDGVDWYNGGMEHTTLHLLYSRFWHKFLYDLKVVPTSEPYLKRTSHGMILASGGEKMSKSKGNVINPDEIIDLYGADTLRLYEMFMGPFDQDVSWSTESIIGPRRFLEKFWNTSKKVIEVNTVKTNKSIEKSLHKTIKKISEDIENMSFNTAISSMMILLNKIESGKYEISIKDFKLFIQLLAPFAPHITEEIWNGLGEKGTIHLSNWPKWDNKKIIDDEVRIVIQINGKVRTNILVNSLISEDEIKDMAMTNDIVKKWISGKKIKRFIYIPNKIINFVL